MDLDKPISVTQARGQCKKGISRLMKLKNISLEDAFILQRESFELSKFDYRAGELKELEYILDELYKEMQETLKEEERLRDPKVQARRLAKRLKKLSQKKTT